MSGRQHKWAEHAKRQRMVEQIRRGAPFRARQINRSTFVEDPLPDRPMRDRGVTLPRLKFLEHTND